MRPEIKVGDLVKVVGGPAFVAGSSIKGKVHELFDHEGTPSALVRVAGRYAGVVGGEWGFRVEDLEILPMKRRPGTCRSCHRGQGEPHAATCNLQREMTSEDLVWSDQT